MKQGSSGTSIFCPECSTSFFLRDETEESLIGSKFHCSSCDSVFLLGEEGKARLILAKALSTLAPPALTDLPPEEPLISVRQEVGEVEEEEYLHEGEGEQGEEYEIIDETEGESLEAIDETVNDYFETEPVLETGSILETAEPLKTEPIASEENGENQDEETGGYAALEEEEEIKDAFAASASRDWADLPPEPSTSELAFGAKTSSRVGASSWIQDSLGLDDEKKREKREPDAGKQEDSTNEAVLSKSWNFESPKSSEPEEFSQFGAAKPPLSGHYPSKQYQNPVGGSAGRQKGSGASGSWWISAPVLGLTLVLLISSFGARSGFRLPFIGELLTSSFPHWFEQVPAEGLLTKSVKLRRMRVASGEGVQVIYGKIENAGQDILKDPVVEGLLFDKKGNLIANRRIALSQSIPPAQIEALTLPMLERVQSNAKNGAEILRPEDEKLFSIIFSSNESRNAAYFSARVYSVAY